MGQVAQMEPPSVLASLASHYGMDKRAFVETMKATVMNGANVTNEQLAAFCLVAKEHKLNPFTKEIFAFPQRGGIVPVVSVDGWMKLVNSHPEFDGMDFEDVWAEDKLVSVTCKMYRKNHRHPITVTEYMAECRRDTDVWRKWPARMLRHKATIQAARYAFGFAGIYEPDEAERMEEVRIVSEYGDSRTPLIADQRKARCDEAAEQYAPSVAAIKEHIANEDWVGMSECWGEIPQAAQMDLYLAPSKGGVFSTHERKCIKERQVRETPSDNPDFPLED